MKYDVFSEFKYEKTSNRYRVAIGSAKGQFISKKAFLASTERYIVTQSEKLQSIGQSLIDKKISVKEFQSLAAKTLKEIHISQAILANDGVENIKSEQWLIVARQLKQQYNVLV